MKQLAKNVLGIFVIEDGEPIDWSLFDTDDPETIAGKLAERTDEEDRLAARHEAEERVQMDAFELGQEAGAIENRDELQQLQVAVAHAWTQDRLAESGSHDQVLVQASRALEDIDQINNELIERLRPWYALFYPEQEDSIDNHEEFARHVAKEFAPADEEPALEVSDTDESMLRDLAERVRDGQRFRKDLEGYIGDKAEKLAPNLSAVLGKTLAARVISEAGSLEKLAKMPSSTVQVLGAEKALFRHMRGEGSAPKHGVLFMHPKVHSLPEDRRGKMARYIANKAVIAARIDFYDGDFKGDAFREELDQQYEEMTE